MSFLLQPRRTIHPMDSRRWIWIIRWLLAFSALAGIVLVYRSWLHVNPTTVALTLLLYILLLAAEWGLRYAVLISIAAAVCYNFFFLPPVGTLTISDPQNWLALLAFLVTAILASRLSELARDEATEARTKQRELEVLFRLSRELLQSESVAALLSSVPAAVVSVTAAEAGMLYLLEGDRVYQAEMSGVSERDFPYLRRLATSLPGIVSDGEQMQIPLRTGLRPTGVLLLRRVALSDETAEAIGRVISISIDRAEALEGLARGEAAKESERLRTLMIDSITHELRTPLTSIKGAATALLTGDIQPLEAKELLTIIDEESDRLNRLVSEAVQMAQLDAQQVKMHFGPVAVRDLIDAARDACSWVGEEHLLHFEMPKSLEVRGDAGVLQKVISNLLENAAKYSSPGTPITISSERRNDTVAISVADRGIGIDASEQALIFERSYRAGSQAHQSAGTGMGLAIGRAIAIAHGGNIEVTSQLGRGSVFTLTLPAFSGSLDSTRQTTLQESGEL
jgi:two-component system sensor histidine kinase KdpD